MTNGLERLLFERSQDAIVLYKAINDGEDFLFADLNPACEQIEGVRADDLIGRRVTEAFPAIDDFGLLDVFRRVWNTAKPETFGMSLYTDDRIAGYRENYVTRLDAEGLLAAIYHDTTDLRGLLDSVFGYIGVYTLDGRVIDVNKMPLSTAGLDRMDVIGKPFWETFWISHSPDSQARVRDWVERAANGETVRDKIRMRINTTDVVVMDTTIGPLPDADGNVSRLFSFAVDISEQEAAVEALRQSDHRYRHAQAIAKIGSWELDLTQNTLWWSDEIYRLFEIDPERFEATYEAFLNAIHPEDRAAVSEAYERSLKDRSAYSIEHRLQMPDGRIKWVEEHGETEFSEDGTPLISRGSVQDITERKNTETALAESDVRFRTLIAASPNAISLKDTDGRYMVVNKAFTTMFDIPADAVVGRSINDFDYEPDYAELINAMDAETITTGDTIRREVAPPITAHGALYTYTVKFPVRDAEGSIVAIGTIDTDISELKSVEASAIAAQFEAEKANRAKSDFLAAMSHEIRTPLNAVIGFAEALEHGIGADDPERRNETLRIIARAGKQLNNLIGDILDYSKIEADKVTYNFETLYPGDVLEESMPVVDRLLTENGIEFIWSEKTKRRISVDKMRLN